MKLKVKKGKVSLIFDQAFPYVPFPLDDNNKSDLLYLRRLAKRTGGLVQVKSIQFLIIKGFPMKKKSNGKYDVWKL